MLKGKLLAIAYNSNDEVVAAAYVQTPQVIDALYTKANNDANEARYHPEAAKLGWKRTVDFFKEKLGD